MKTSLANEGRMLDSKTYKSEIKRLKRENKELRDKTKNIPKTEEELKDYCVNFFLWWWNQPGTCTHDGYEVWRVIQLGKEKSE